MSDDLTDSEAQEAMDALVGDPEQVLAERIERARVLVTRDLRARIIPSPENPA